jgi:hypothetical protein
MEIYDQLEELRHAVEYAEGTLPRLAALSAFFAAGQQELSNENSAGHYTVFHQTAYLLTDRVADGVVWDWLQEQARAAATPQRQEEMRVALFELAPDHPIIWSDLYRLWDFWFDPAARWALFSAYWCFPRRLPAHLARYIAHRRRHKLPVPEFSHDEFQAWLRQAKEEA